MNRWSARFLVLLLGWGAVVSVQETSAACPADVSAGSVGGGLVKRLPSQCTQAERETQAVSGAAILEALENGQPVELVGVIVRGDLNLDRVPVQRAAAREGLTPEEQARAKKQELRLIRGALIISDSVVTGAVRHRSDHGMLQFEGPVDFHGTMFQEGVDLSRSIFQGPVELAGAAFQKEAYFIQGRFMQGMRCKDTKFGPHARFHRSTFQGPVDCTGALFDGVAEWLEVTFEQPAVFERARFGSGTGFSGSRFMRRASFDEAIFSRDTFFTFSVFEETAVFAGAQFLGPADFSDADFRRPDDLVKARFDQPPLFTRTKRAAREQAADIFDSPIGRYGVTVVCLLLAAGLAGYVLKSR
jgi:uncharacterized protein YjbI with pentapeptide repeats